MLAHPLTRDLDIDDPATTDKRRLIVHSKPFLHRLYQHWYRTLVAELPDGAGSVVELGSGPGFLSDYIPNLITSEIFSCGNIRVVLDGRRLALAPRSLKAIVMTDVLHHLPSCRDFFSEAVRCLRPGGRIVMIEPWVTGWSEFVYTKFHHEPFDPRCSNWDLLPGGALSAANGALPWIVFNRDREMFDREFGELRITAVRPMMPFCYLVSGGVSLRSLMPAFSFRWWRALESALEPWIHKWAMFALIVIERR